VNWAFFYGPVSGLSRTSNGIFVGALAGHPSSEVPRERQGAANREPSAEPWEVVSGEWELPSTAYFLSSLT